MNDLIFIPETHSYFITGIQLQSVTNFIGEFFSKFDVDTHSARKAAQLGISQDEVREMWSSKGRQSADFGTKVHKYAECKAKNLPLPTADSLKMQGYFNAVDKMMADNNVRVIDAERRIGSLPLLLGGTIDLLSKRDSRVFISDWKTNACIDLDNKYLKFGINPLHEVQDCNFNHYSLQLSLYAFILEHAYNEKIDALELIWLKENEYTLVDVPYLKDKIIDMLKHSGKWMQ